MHFGHSASFWFGSFVKIFVLPGVSSVMKTLEGEQYVVIRLISVPLIRFGVICLYCHMLHVCAVCIAIYCVSVLSVV